LTGIYTWSATADISLKADIFISAYPSRSNFIIGALGKPYNVKTYYGLFISGTDKCGCCDSNDRDRCRGVGAVGFTNNVHGCCSATYSTLNTVPLNAWTTVEARRTSGSWSFYINGQLSDHHYAPERLTSLEVGNSNVPVYIGFNANDDHVFEGSISNVYIDGRLVST